MTAVGFYSLEKPIYDDFLHGEQANPVRSMTDIALPGVICDRCGNIWAGSRRTYLTIEDPELRARLRHVGPIPWGEWVALAEAVRRHLGLTDRFVLKPGDRFGAPVIELSLAEVPDFTHPFPGQVLVTEKVVDALRRAHFTGQTAVRVEVVWGGKDPPPTQMPALFELGVTGTAWRRGMDLDRITDCPQCRRLTFPMPKELDVDPEQWDGSDFFHVDRNYNIVLVTPGVCEFLREEGFVNFACMEFPEANASRVA